MNLNIGYFYSEELNLYGDNGNVEILKSRAQARGITTNVFHINMNTKMDDSALSTINLVFMGGGPDSGQKAVYKDLLNTKAIWLKQYVENLGVGLFICGAYQLMGNYYLSADKTKLDGLGIFDLHTISFGNHRPRCIGNISCELNPQLRHDPLFNSLNHIGSTLVGFENHGGRTYLGSTMAPLAKVVKGYGNNGEDSTEGVLYKNSIGTYLHGPLLSKNPHLADYLIATSCGLQKLPELNDKIISSAHTASKTYS